MIEPIENTVSHLPQHIFHDDLGTLVAEVSTALVSGPGWEQGAVMREDLVGDHLKLLEDPHHDMEDFLIENFAKACPKIGERSFTGQVLQMEAGIGSVGPSHVFISEQRKDIAAVEVPVKNAKQIDQEEAGRIIARRSNLRVAIRDQAADKGEIDQRGDHPWVTTANRTVGKNLDKPFIEPVV
jgi:hypothetical protein